MRGGVYIYKTKQTRNIIILQTQDLSYVEKQATKILVIFQLYCKVVVKPTEYLQAAHRNITRIFVACFST